MKGTLSGSKAALLFQSVAENVGSLPGDEFTINLAMSLQKDLSRMNKDQVLTFVRGMEKFVSLLPAQAQVNVLVDVSPSMPEMEKFFKAVQAGYEEKTKES